MPNPFESLASELQMADILKNHPSFEGLFLERLWKVRSQYSEAEVCLQQHLTVWVNLQ